MNLEQSWDKVFPKSDKVDHQKVTFKNRFGITLVADMYKPKDAAGNKLAAIAVSGPYGAVKEQVSGRYAQVMAERGFLTIAFDPSFTGESSGEPRSVASPDLNTEDFSAAVDYLASLDNVNPEAIGIIGICGWGGFALNAAAADPRIKATLASTMYDMTRVSANGYFDADDSKEKRIAARKALAEQRNTDYKSGKYEFAGPVVDPVTDDMPQFVKDYNSFYRQPRGFHKRSIGSTTGFTKTTSITFMNNKLLDYVDEIEAPVLLIHGEKAHSRYFSEGAFEKMTGKHVENESTTVGNKEIMIIPGASHVDLYDNLEVIPFDKIDKFFKDNLK